eukprot:5463867-Prymnesium_polylepis.1
MTTWLMRSKSGVCGSPPSSAVITGPSASCVISPRSSAPSTPSRRVAASSITTSCPCASRSGSAA